MGCMKTAVSVAVLAGGPVARCQRGGRDRPNFPLWTLYGPVVGHGYVAGANDDRPPCMWNEYPISARVFCRRGELAPA